MEVSWTKTWPGICLKRKRSFGDGGDSPLDCMMDLSLPSSQGSVDLSPTSSTGDVSEEGTPSFSEDSARGSGTSEEGDSSSDEASSGRSCPRHTQPWRKRFKRSLPSPGGRNGKKRLMVVRPPGVAPCLIPRDILSSQEELDETEGGKKVCLAEARNQPPRRRRDGYGRDGKDCGERSVDEWKPQPGRRCSMADRLRPFWYGTGDTSFPGSMPGGMEKEVIVISDSD